jgi:DNA-binding CsgD family transcriptional regulator
MDSVPRVVEKIARLAVEGRDLHSLWRESTDVLRAVPHFLTPCWFTVDPASFLITSHVNDTMDTIPPEWLEQEYYQEDVNKIADVARSPRGISTLHEATGGDPSRSPHWQQMAEFGAEQELVVGLRTRTGEVWGALSLYREPGRPMFDATEMALLVAVAPHLAEGARRALLLAEAGEPRGPDAPGLLVLAPDGQVEAATPEVDQWLELLPDGDWKGGRLPSAVVSVAGQAWAPLRRGHDPGQPAMARVLSRSGRWLMLHGTPLISADRRSVAVVVEPAHPARVASLLMSAYALTGREQDVTRLVLRGYSTTEVAASLFITPHTVHQHLKRIFDKTGVRSRRDLMGKVFFTHYEPGVRDNEQRMRDGRPIRSGPAWPDPGTR